MAIVVIADCPQLCGPPGTAGCEIWANASPPLVGGLGEHEVLDARQVVPRFSPLSSTSSRRRMTPDEQIENKGLTFHNPLRSPPLPFVRRSVRYRGAVAPRVAAALLGVSS